MVADDANAAKDALKKAEAIANSVVSSAPKAPVTPAKRKVAAVNCKKKEDIEQTLDLAFP